MELLIRIGSSATASDGIRVHAISPGMRVEALCVEWRHYALEWRHYALVWRHYALEWRHYALDWRHYVEALECRQHFLDSCSTNPTS